jgi:hypothetical protein
MPLLDVVQTVAGHEKSRRTIAYHPGPSGVGDVEAVEADVGMVRDRLLADSVCRYINTGGDVDGARRVCEGVLANILSLSAGADINPMVPRPWRLFDTQMRGSHEHVFYDPQTGNAVIWNERNSITKTSLEQIANAASTSDSKT